MKKNYLQLDNKKSASWRTISKSVYCLLFTAFCLLFTVYCPLFFVSASYMLPYPSYMPGNKLYRVSRIIDNVKHFWYWGTIAQLKYHVGLSDKYLVEAKTLFEYKQYLLATDALKRSDQELSDIMLLVDEGNREGKDMSEQKKIVSESMQVHVVTLAEMKNQLPGEFVWTPEKSDPQKLSIGSMLDTSIQIRQMVGNEGTMR
jgi:hypothetical protein